MRKNCLYERGLGWVRYDEVTCRVLLGDRARTRMCMLRQGKCFCPRDKIWQCDGMCEDCPYQKTTEVSWNMKVGGSESLTLGEALPDGVDHENFCVEKIYYTDILKKLDELMPQARRIGLLRLEGKSDRQISEILGIPRTSIYRMLEKVQAILKKEFEEN